MWKSFPSKSEISPRVGATLTSLGSSTLILNGASHEEGPLAQTLLFSHSKNTIVKVDSPFQPRYDHTAALVQSKNSVLMFGGCGELGALNDLWILNLETFEWRQSINSNGPCARSSPSSIVLDGIFYVFGGGSSGVSPVNDEFLWSYTIESDTWTRINEKGPGKRQGHSMLTFDHEIYVLFGMSGSDFFNDVWKFNTSTRRWLQLLTTDAPNPRSGASVNLINATVTVFGGLGQINSSPVALDDVHSLDLKTLQWSCEDSELSMSPGPPGGRIDAGSCQMVITEEDCPEIKSGLSPNEFPKSSMLIFGGMDMSGMFNDFYLRY